MSSTAPSMGEQHSTRPTAATEEGKRKKRTFGEDAAPAPGHSAQNVPRDYRTINGWGADLDPANRPSVPKELPSDVMTVRSNVGHRQKPTTKIHQSNEQPDLTPVFGTSCPPHGLSGLLRDYAYQYGEATNRHWLTLMLADRVDVVESTVRDVFRGRPDNYVREKGWSAKVKYGESTDGTRAILIGGAVLGAVALGVVLTRALRSD
jgi:hypothetical protein